MPSYADDDLISLVDSVGESSVAAEPVSPSDPFTNKMASNRRAPAQRDSFSDLAGLMKAKKPYTPISPPTSRLTLSVASNDVHFASCVASGSSIISPLARPYRPDGSVAAYLQDRTRSPTSETTCSGLDYQQKDMHRLESILQELENLPFGSEDGVTAQQFDVVAEPLLPDFDYCAPAHIRPGLVHPPTPAESTKPIIPEEPTVRVTMHVWDAMSQGLKTLEEEKRLLEVKVARLEKSKHTATDQVGHNSDELQTQIGKLQYQNEINKVQKATMARTLSEKDIQIKQLELELDNAKQSLETTAIAVKDHADVVAERDYLQTTLKNDRASDSGRLADAVAVRERQIQTLSTQVNNLQEALNLSEIQPNAAPADNIAELKRLAENRLEQLKQREKSLRSTQERYATEHTKVGELEDQLEDLRRKLNQVGDFEDRLREKTSECDRFRNKVKIQEKVVDDYKQRVVRASNNGAALRGASHLVKPSANATFSTLVLGCSECYAKNISCDNKTRCRNCTENNQICARWRCSLKHILGECPDAPCRFPHEKDGWLLQPDPRPQW